MNPNVNDRCTDSDAPVQVHWTSTHSTLAWGAVGVVYLDRGSVHRREYLGLCLCVQGGWSEEFRVFLSWLRIRERLHWEKGKLHQGLE